MFDEPIQLTRSFDARIGRTYIWCTDDERGIEGFAEVTRPFDERAQTDPNWRFHHLAAIHDAYIDSPESVAKLFNEAAGGS